MSGPLFSTPLSVTGWLQFEHAPSEDSDQPGHPPSLISLRRPHEESLGP